MPTLYEYMNAADNTALTAHTTFLNWTAEGSFTFKILANAATPSATNGASIFQHSLGGDTGADDHWTQTYVTPGTNAAGPTVRATHNGLGYTAMLNSDGHVYLYTRNLNTGAMVAYLTSSSSGQPAYGCVRMQVSGTTPVVIRVWMNDVLVITYNDSSGTKITAGTCAGITAYYPNGTAPSIGNFFARPGAPPPFVVTTSPNTQPLRVIVPTAYNQNIGTHIILFAHANNGDSTDGTGRSLGSFRNALALADAGYIVACPNMHGNNWGSPTGVTDLVDAYAYLVTTYRTRWTGLFGQSMGGVASLNAIADARIANIRAWAGVVPVCDLPSIWQAGNGPLAADIRYGWGLASNGSQDSTFATITAGSNPTALNPTAFNGIRMYFRASPDDTTVPSVTNTTVMAALVTGHAASVTVAATSGPHGNPSDFNPDELANFFATAFDTPPTITTATDLLDYTNGIETGVTLRQAIRAIAAVLAGTVTGAGTGTETFHAIGGDAPRITVTATPAGNRTAVTSSL